MTKKLTPQMLEKLLEKARAGNKTFPTTIRLVVDGEEIFGLLYEDGRFEDTKNKEPGEMGAESETGDSVAKTGI